MDIEADNSTSIHEPSRQEESSGDTSSATNLRNYWYPLAEAKRIRSDCTFATELFGEPLVLFRDEEGRAKCLQDKCSHRSAPLSIGSVDGGKIICRYHGWTFDGEGECVDIPSLPKGNSLLKSAGIYSYPCEESQGLVFVWPGDKELAKQSLLPPVPPEIGEERNEWSSDILQLDVDIPFRIVLENLLDPSHIWFAHQGTLARGPFEAFDIDLKEESEKGSFSGVFRKNKTAFYPGCRIRLEAFFPNGWRFNQEFFVVPLNFKKSRIFNRFFRDWLKFLPIWTFNRSMALQIWRQDDLLLKAQQLRLEQGANPFNLGVKIDAMTKKFRRWVSESEKKYPPWFKEFKPRPSKGTNNVNTCSEIEDMPKESCDSCLKNCSVIGEIKKQSPEVWPSEKKFRKREIWPTVKTGLFFVVLAYVLATSVWFTVERLR